MLAWATACSTSSRNSATRGPANWLNRLATCAAHVAILGFWGTTTTSAVRSLLPRCDPFQACDASSLLERNSVGVGRESHSRSRRAAL